MCVSCIIAFDYVDWMWHLLSMDCSGSHAQEMLKYQLYTLINFRKVAWYKQQGESGLIVSVLHFVYVDLHANGYKYPPYTID